MGILILTLIFLALILFPIRLSADKSFDSLSFQNGAIIKGICSILVILHHFAQSSAGSSLLSSLLAEGAGYLAVACFFFFSGYGLMRSHLDKPGYARSFLRRRVLPLVLAYAFFLLLHWLVSFANHAGYTALDLIRSFLTTYPAFKMAWYLAVTLLFYLFFYLLMVLLKDKSSLFLPCSLLWCAVWVGICLFGGLSIYWCNTCLCISLGIYVALYRQKIDAAVKKHYLLLGAVNTLLFLAAVLCAAFFAKSEFQKFLFSALGSLFFVAEVLLVTMSVRFGNKIWPFLSTISLEVYLTHPLYMRLLRSQLLYIPSDLIWGALVIALTIPTAYCIHAMLTKAAALFQKKAVHTK